MKKERKELSKAGISYTFTVKKFLGREKLQVRTFSPIHKSYVSELNHKIFLMNFNALVKIHLFFVISNIYIGSFKNNNMLCI